MKIVESILYKRLFLLRLVSYSSIWCLYLYFMNQYAPHGTGWLSWHEQRITNALDFLRINGYFSFNGFGIWDYCSDCSLSKDLWSDKIYTSHHSISYFPYLILNYLFGKDALIYFGPLIDKFVIFISGVAISEIARGAVREKSKLPAFVISIICFSFFSFNPWTYKMILASWTEIYFLMFFLLGLISFNKAHHYLGLFLFFCCALFHYQWAFFIAFFYLSILFVQFLWLEKFSLEGYLPGSNFRLNAKIALSLIIPTCGIILLKIITESGLESPSDSNVLYRIGISGVDIHNGGLLGALQFLGGNRVTHCISGIDLGLLSSSLDLQITLFNCILSIGSMFLISIVSVIGISQLLRQVSVSKVIILPLLFSLIAMICVFQQSLSAHLMGYSYVFSVLFAVGLTSIFSLTINSEKLTAIKIIFLIPLTLGVLITCIRVSMLTGVNG